MTVEREVRRRDALRAGLVAMTLPVGLGMRPGAMAEVRSFRLIESAGLRRFGYPVHTTVPDAAKGRNFRLIRDGRLIPAQFRTVTGIGGEPEVVLDFSAGAGPLETARYQVQFGNEIEPPPEPKSGLSVEKRDGRLFVAQGSSMTFEVAEDLSGFLQSVGGPRLGYIREGSVGLSVRDRGQSSSRPVSGVRTSVTRQGQFAAGLQSDWTGSGNSRHRLELTIPHSKTWIQAVWSVDDPENVIAGLSLDLKLLLEGAETLVDFGAGTTVYGQIKKNQVAELVAGQAKGEPKRESGSGWVIRLGDEKSPPIFAASTMESPRAVEGWAHVMDARRCTAVAVADFGKSNGRDAIRISNEGKLLLTRDFAAGDVAPRPGPKSLAFWLHFVPMPVQVGALTSPQSILASLQLEWDRPPHPG